MNWTITVKPTTSELTEWSWTAVRSDQENTLSGSGYATSAEAMSAAQAEAQAFENTLGVIQNETVTVVFVPAVPA